MHALATGLRDIWRAAGLASHLRLENTMIAGKHTHVRSATWRALRHAATALRHVHREPALMWEPWWQANRASVPSTGALRSVLTLDGHRLAGGHLATPRHDAAGGAA